MATNVRIGGELESRTVEGIIADANTIIDRTNGNKRQDVMNRELAEAIAGKQQTLVSGTNIKTVNGNSLLGSGDLEVGGGGTSAGTLNTANTTSQSPSSSESLGGTVQLHKVSKTGNYNDLLGNPVLATVATTGNYDDLSNRPLIPDVSGKANKSEMLVTQGTGANADKTTIQLKSGTTATVLRQHQDLSSKQDVISDLGTIRVGAAAGATAQQPATTIEGYGITNAYRKNETYTQQEVNNLVSTPIQDFITVSATNLTTDVAALIAASVAVADQERADALYRIGNWDGTQYDATVYSEYAWDGASYVLLSVKHGSVDIADGAITEQKIADSAVTLDKMKHSEYLNVYYGDNLIDLNATGLIMNKWIKSEGVLENNANYLITDYIPVTVGTTYYFGDDGIQQWSVGRTWEFYDINQDVIIGSFVNNDPGHVTSFTAPANSVYVRLSVYQGYNRPQLNAGSLKAYSEWREYVKVDGREIEDASIPLVKLQDKSEIDELLLMGDTIEYIKSDNLLNPNDAGVLDNKYINVEGHLSTNADYFVSGYIQVTPGLVYYAGNNGEPSKNVIRTFEFYNIEKQVIPGSFVDNSSATSFTAPQNSVYVRTSVFKGNTYPQLNVNSLKPYSPWEEPEVQLKGDKLIDGSVEFDKLQNGEDLEKAVHVADLFTTYTGDNLLNVNDPDVLDGKVLSASGIYQNNESYFVSGYIQVVPGSVYYAGNNGSPMYNIIRNYEFYTANKERISGTFVDNTSSSNTSFVAPSGSFYVRTSTFKGNTKPQINKDSLKPYTPWEAPYEALSGSSIEKNSIDEDRLSGEVRKKLGKPSFAGFEESGSISQNEYLTLPMIHIQKNNVLSCDITGNLTKISIGVGYLPASVSQYKGYAALWVEIDSTNIKQYRAYNSAPQLINTVQHGITLTSQTKVVMDFGVNNGKVRLFNDLGAMFESTIQSAGVGTPFVQNNGASSLTCTLRDYPRDLTKKIWLFADSYVSFVSDARWAYYFKDYGYIDWFCNSQPGLAPDYAVTDLNNLLTLGYKPSMLVWMLGMNGDTVESQSGGTYVINSYQKTNIDTVVNICQANGIELVLTTIPTVPDRQKTGFNNYVKSLGVRYIDWAKAVGTNSSGQWNAGLLSSDNVHPTALGAKVLASQVLADCPELTLVD